LHCISATISYVRRMLPNPKTARTAAAVSLILAVLLLAACANTASTLDPPQPAVAKLPCENVLVAVWAQGTELRQYYTDHHGRDIEVWCYRGVFRSHWDVRVGWDEQQGARPVHHSATIGGCFFDNGQSVGPYIAETADDRYAKVAWTNEDPANEHKKYRFDYDFGTGQLTITGTIPGAPATTKTVAAPPGWDQLKAQLPFPPD
jgi:hypothetical protein